MSCSSVIPTFPRPSPGETTTDCWPQGLSRSTPINFSTFGVGSQNVSLVPQTPWPSGAYTTSLGALTLYNSTQAAVAAGQPLQFRSQADRIRYRLACLQQNN